MAGLERLKLNSRLEKRRLARYIHEIIGSYPFNVGAYLDVVHDGTTSLYGPTGVVVTSTNAMTNGQLEFTPFWSGAGGTLDQIAFQTTVAGTTGNIGACALYDGDQTLLLPTTLIFDGGQFDLTAAAGVKLTTMSPVVRLLPSRLYWFGFICVTGVAPTCTTISSGFHILGRRPSDLSALGAYIKAGQTYAGAMPATAPSGLTTTTTSSIALVVARWNNYNRTSYATV